MRKTRQHRPEGERVQQAWEAATDDHCLICGRASHGKAICADPNCATELAMG